MIALCIIKYSLLHSSQTKIHPWLITGTLLDLLSFLLSKNKHLLNGFQYFCTAIWRVIKQNTWYIKLEWVWDKAIELLSYLLRRQLCILGIAKCSLYILGYVYSVESESMTFVTDPGIGLSRLSLKICLYL